LTIEDISHMNKKVHMRNKMTDPRIFHLLQRAHSALFRAADRRLQADTGLTAAQYAVLLVLSQCDGQPITAIADELRMGKSSLTGLVDRMSARGLVRREVDADDARVQRVFIAAKGQKLAQSALGDVRRINAQLLKPFSASDRKTIERFLLHVSDNAAGIVDNQQDLETNREGRQ
jgi:DNA-binding MarR family transcriptional regulator